MFRAYLDESEAGVIFAVGGFVGTESQWSCLERPWLDALPPGVISFHASDCFGGAKAFEGLPIPARLELLDRLTDLVLDAGLKLICGAIDNFTYSQFARKKKRDEFLINKYAAAGGLAVQLACEAIPATGPLPDEPSKNDGPNEKCNFFFERNEYRASMADSIQQLRQDTLLWWRGRIGADSDGTKTGEAAIPLLQVGDFGVFLGAKKLSNSKQGRMPWEPYYEKLAKAQRVRIRWADERSIRIVAGLHEELKREAAEGTSYWDDV